MKHVSLQFDSDKARQWSNLIAIVAAFAINIYANVSPPSGATIGDISNQLFSQVQIIPANYAFAIWGLIYLGLITFGIYQALPVQRNNSRLRRIGYLLVLASLAQIIWIFLFQYQLFLLSVLVMLGILLPLIGIYIRLGIGWQRVPRIEVWLVHIPLSIYLAWISVATIVNVASALYYFGWNGWGISPQVWTIIMLVVGAAIAFMMAQKQIDVAYPLVIIWAFVAVAVRQIAQPPIAITAGGLAIALGLFVLFKVLLTGHKNRNFKNY